MAWLPFLHAGWAEKVVGEHQQEGWPQPLGRQYPWVERRGLPQSFGSYWLMLPYGNTIAIRKGRKELGGKVKEKKEDGKDEKEENRASPLPLLELELGASQGILWSVPWHPFLEHWDKTSLWEEEEKDLMCFCSVGFWVLSCAPPPPFACYYILFRIPSRDCDVPHQVWQMGSVRIRRIWTSGLIQVVHFQTIIFEREYQKQLNWTKLISSDTGVGVLRDLAM